MEGYFHSVRLDRENCKGCTNCIRHCPTEAIRVRDGKAQINEERCIDCGECIRVCPNHAKIAVSDSLEKLKNFKYKIALPAPAFYGQFERETGLECLLSALLNLGFDHVFEVAYAAELISAAIGEYIDRFKRPRPLISQACPAVVSLLQVRFPLLLSHLIPIDSPMNAAARMAKDQAKSLGFKENEIGTFFITPCPAKITVTRQPPANITNYVDGVLSIAHIYGQVFQEAKKSEQVFPVRASALGINWGHAGGEARAIGKGNTMHVDGIHNVISVLEEVEKGSLGEIDYLECQACVGGCVGGALTVANPYVAKLRLTKIGARYGESKPGTAPEIISYLRQNNYFKIGTDIKERSSLSLDHDVATAINKMKLLEETLKSLPGLDCGSCGAPTCRALAEDIVRGLSVETDCVFKLREKVSKLAREVMELASKAPPAMGGVRLASQEPEGEQK